MEEPEEYINTDGLKFGKDGKGKIGREWQCIEVFNELISFLKEIGSYSSE